MPGESLDVVVVRDGSFESLSFARGPVQVRYSKEQVLNNITNGDAEGWGPEEFNIIETGKYKGLKEMCFYKHYPNPENPRNENQKYILYQTTKNIKNRFRVYFKIILKIFNHFNFFISIYLITKLIIMRLFSKLKLIKLKPKPSEY